VLRDFTSDFVTPHERGWRMLTEAFVGQPHLRFLEIGSLEGRSACWWLDHVLTHPTSTLTCIDCWGIDDIERRFDHNITTTGRAAQIRKYKARSRSALKEVEDGSIDLAYIDGSHEGRDVLLDGLLVLPLMRPQGVILFDDYGLAPECMPPGYQRLPREAIDTFLAFTRDRVQQVSGGYQVAVRVRDRKADPAVSRHRP